MDRPTGALGAAVCFGRVLLLVLPWALGFSLVACPWCTVAAAVGLAPIARVLPRR